MVTVPVKLSFLPYAEGGRVCLPFGSGYAPFLRTDLADHDLAVRLNDVPVSAEFGQEFSAELVLTYWGDRDYGPLSRGTPFELIEGPKVVARGFFLSEPEQS